MGHVQRDCPDIWRRFHLTLEGESPVSFTAVGHSSDKHQADVWCCNCGRRGHLADECRRFAYSPYPRTSLRVVHYEAPRTMHHVDAGTTPLSRRAAEKAAAKADKWLLKQGQFNTCPNSPREPSGGTPSAKRFRSVASSPPEGPSVAPNFIR